MPGQDWMLGTGGELQRDQARLDGRHRWLPQRWRDLHRLHHAGIPGQVHAVYGCASGFRALDQSRRTMGWCVAAAARDNQHDREQRTEMAPPARRTHDRLRANKLRSQLNAFIGLENSTGEIICLIS